MLITHISTNISRQSRMLVLLSALGLHLIKACWIGEAFQGNLGRAEQHDQRSGPFRPVLLHYQRGLWVERHMCDAVPLVCEMTAPSKAGSAFFCPFVQLVQRYT